MRVFRFVLILAAIALIAPGIGLANDQEIVDSIRGQLLEQQQSGQLAGFSIDLTVEEGVVWMSGRVASSSQQTLALGVAQRVPGVKQVVNDLAIAAPTATTTASSGGDSQSVLKGMGNAISSALFGKSEENNTVQQVQAQVPVNQPANQESQERAYGSGVAAKVPQLSRASSPSVPNIPRTNYAPAQMQRATPVGYSRVAPVNYQGEYTGQPVPMTGGNGVGIAPARYDHPYMPNHSWPSYAAYPNYAAVTYPKQYSPTAWPYIGPFYPYPQVPLGWRKVTLEWDDGWWMLDFKDRRHR